ncbi:class I SAM-dependent methyltransferase [Mesorhizobium marinum]|uniref:class I SAM-dependent methyltransferase n=1 Tax=Mesorhizobium marinum TaxID=3228790 RepID=UPI00346722BE
MTIGSEEQATKMDDLYVKSESLRIADECVREFGLDDRASILSLIPKNSIGAEIGVFTGMFSEKIISIVNPTKLYLVDWWEKQGEYFGDWGKYTDFGRLNTADAKSAVRYRSREYAKRETVELVESESVDWLSRQPECSLDWVYLDTDHKYGQTLEEIRIAASRLRPGGMILGDDWYPDYRHVHAGVMLAVNDFVRESDYNILIAGRANQWLIMKCPEVGELEGDAE